MHEIATLKKYVINSKDLSEPLNYFFDLMDENKIFNATGHRQVEQQNDELMLVVSVVKDGISSILNKSFGMIEPAFYEIPQEHFYHGICILEDAPLPTTILYFSDIQMGIYALTDMTEVKMIRFTVAKESEWQNKH